MPVLAYYNFVGADKIVAAGALAVDRVTEIRRDRPNGR